jgi:hypothetical protein
MIVYYATSYQVSKVYSDLQKNRLSDGATANFLSCPAVRDTFHNVFMVCPEETSTVVFEGNEATRTEGFPLLKKRAGQLDKTNNFNLHEYHYFFSEESVKMKVTAPYFHKSEYLKNGAIISGVFDISKWFRPVASEIITWAEKGEMTFMANEPLMYVEFLTETPVILKRYSHTPILEHLANGLVNSPFSGSPQGSLKSRYESFMTSNYREGILEEIKSNLVSEDIASPSV